MTPSFTPTLQWDVSAITGGYVYTYTVTLDDTRPDMSHFGIEWLGCPDALTMFDHMASDLTFTPDYGMSPGFGPNVLKWDDLDSGNAPGVWTFSLFSDRLPIEGTAIAKGATHSVTFETQVPGCAIVPEPTTTLLLVLGLVAAILRRGR
jgi:hypothetical protein